MNVVLYRNMIHAEDAELEATVWYSHLHCAYVVQVYNDGVAQLEVGSHGFKYLPDAKCYADFLVDTWET